MRENSGMSSGFLVLPVAMALLLLGMLVVIAVIGNAVTGAEASVQPTTVVQGATQVAAAAPTTAPTAEATEAVAETAESTAVAEAVPAGAINFDTRVVQTGRSLFQTTCAACHASNARGIPGIGKNLVASEFVRGMSDEELLHFIVVGRSPTDPLNTTGIIMPARGGNPALSDPQIHDIIVFIRSEAQTEFGTAYLENVDVGTAASVASQAEAAPAPTEDPEFVLPITLLGLDQASEATVEPEVTEDPNFVLPITALGLDGSAEATAEATVEAAPAEAVADIATVRVYNQACAGCHGLQGEGVANVGTPLVGDPTASDPDLLFTYMTTVQMPDPARNGFAHPSRFAFPDLASDDALRALVDYTVTLATGS
jgi:mono/diheme cytochrome c family protein